MNFLSPQNKIQQVRSAQGSSAQRQGEKTQERRKAATHSEYAAKGQKNILHSL